MVTIVTKTLLQRYHFSFEQYTAKLSCIFEMGNVSSELAIKSSLSSNFVSEKRKNIPSESLVRKKLLKTFPSLKGTNKLEDEVQTLSDTTRVKQKYFDHLLERKTDAERVISDEAEAFQDGFRNQQTREASVQVMTKEINRVKQLQVSLVLYELTDKTLMQKLGEHFHRKIHTFDFGAFHAAIQIGDVVIEWGPKGLVIPTSVKPAHEEDPECRSPIMVTSMHAQDLEQSLMSGIGARASYDTVQEGFAKVQKHLHDISTEKEYLFDELAQVIVRYNTKFEYGLFSNNCQHFVLDVLTVLGIIDHNEVFKGKMKEFGEILMAGDKKGFTEFNSHEMLDSFVRDNIDKMTRDHLEWVYCHYLLFHAWSRKKVQEAWRCKPGTCWSGEVFKRMEPMEGQ